jgi:hypothetical protein
MGNQKTERHKSPKQSPPRKHEDEESSRRPGAIAFVSGLAIFLVLWIIVVLLVKFQLAIPHKVLTWLSQSPDPQRAVLSFGALVASLLMAIVRLGIKLPLLKPVMEADNISKYLAGLPLWAILIILVASVAGLLLVVPSCQPPASVTFTVQGQDELLHPSDVLTVAPGETATILAAPIQEGTILSCNWQYVGNAFQTIGASHGCEINIEFTDQAADGYLTLQASQDFCSQSSVFSLQVLVSAP